MALTSAARRLELKQDAGFLFNTLATSCGAQRNPSYQPLLEERWSLAKWLWVKNRVTPKWLALVKGNMDD